MHSEDDSARHEAIDGGLFDADWSRESWKSCNLELPQNSDIASQSWSTSQSLSVACTPLATPQRNPIHGVYVHDGHALPYLHAAAVLSYNSGPNMGPNNRWQNPIHVTSNLMQVDTSSHPNSHPCETEEVDHDTEEEEDHDNEHNIEEDSSTHDLTPQACKLQSMQIQMVENLVEVSDLSGMNVNLLTKMVGSDLDLSKYSDDAAKINAVKRVLVGIERLRTKFQPRKSACERSPRSGSGQRVNTVKKVRGRKPSPEHEQAAARLGPMEFADNDLCRLPCTWDNPRSKDARAFLTWMAAYVRDECINPTGLQILSVRHLNIVYNVWRGMHRIRLYWHSQWLGEKDENGQTYSSYSTPQLFRLSDVIDAAKEKWPTDCTDEAIQRLKNLKSERRLVQEVTKKKSGAAAKVPPSPQQQQQKSTSEGGSGGGAADGGSTVRPSAGPSPANVAETAVGASVVAAATAAAAAGDRPSPPAHIRAALGANCCTALPSLPPSLRPRDPLSLSILPP